MLLTIRGVTSENIGRWSCCRVITLLAAVMFTATVQAQDPIPDYIEQISVNNLTTVATELVTQYGPRNIAYYSPFIDDSCTLGTTVYPKSNLEMAEDYVKSLLESMGYESSAITVETLPNGVGHNIYVTKVGSTYPNVYIEFGAHLDSVSTSPGGCDNASGSTAVIELARVLKDYGSRHSMRFILFAAEEAGPMGVYYGSGYHLQEALARGEQIKAGLVMDHIGWQGSADPTDLVNEVGYNDAESLRIADLFDQVRTDYRIVIGFWSSAFSNSDTNSYWNWGQTAVQSGGGLRSYGINYHGCGDTVSNINFTNVQRIAQQNLAVGLILDSEVVQTSRTTTTALVSSPNPSLYGQLVTLTATVEASSGVPSGNVTFAEGSATLGTSTLDSAGVATFVTSTLSTALHSIVATYDGDTNYDPSTSATVTQTVSVTANPVPSISTLVPASTTVGGTGFVLTVTGSNFVSSSVVRWNGADRTTTFVSASELTATILATDIAATGTAQVTVFSPTPGGGTSGALSFIISAPEAAPEGILLAAYNMDEGSGATLYDRSGNANNGSLVNGPSWQTGKNGTSLYFDGVNDYVSIPASSMLEVAGTALTIEFWANVQTGGTTPDYVIINKAWTAGQMSSPYYQYGLEFWGAGRQFVLIIGSPSGWRYFAIPGGYGVWKHVAFTYDGVNVRGYIDGVQQLASAETGSLTARGTKLLFGVDAVLNQPFKGYLDDLRIYSRALTAAEVLVDMNTPVGGVLEPALTGVSPSSGPSSGDQTVVLSGTSLSGATSVTFGGTAATITSNTTTEVAVTTPAHAAGTVDVVVTTSAGAATLPSAYTYLATPTLTGVNPSSGPTAGGQTVVLSGTDLSGATAVTFGGTAASITSNTATEVTVTTPAHTAGTVDAAVTTSGGTANLTAGYTYLAAPTLTGVNPSSGPAAGGQTVILSGTGLSGATAVTFGGTAATITSNTATEVAVTTPAHVAGTVDVVVTTSNGTATLQAAYTYLAAPALTGVNPSSGPAAGGQTVILGGTGLTGATAVNFGGTAATITSNTATEVTVTTPAHTAGTVDVAVTASGGTATLTAGYTYIAAPALTGVSPTSGPAAGGQTVILTGTGLSGATAVTFGGTVAAITANTATEITAVAPAHSAGTVDVIVTTSGGTFTLVGGYRYDSSAPSITGLSPTSVTAGSGAFTLTVNGASFTTGSIVRWNGSDRVTTYVSSSQLLAAITSADIVSAATVTITVADPSSGGVTSNSTIFTVTNPLPVISKIIPSLTTAGGLGFILTVTGSGFVPTSSINWSGSTRVTTFVSGTRLKAMINSSDIAVVGKFSVTVVNPSPGGGTSNAKTFTVSKPRR